VVGGTEIVVTPGVARVDHLINVDTAAPCNSTCVTPYKDWHREEVWECRSWISLEEEFTSDVILDILRKTSPGETSRNSSRSCISTTEDREHQNYTEEKRYSRRTQGPRILRFIGHCVFRNIVCFYHICRVCCSAQHYSKQI
jgi:hypothetical protein